MNRPWPRRAHPLARTSMRAPGRLLLAAVVVFLGLPGCVSFSTFQSPQVLEPGETRLGGGLLLGVDLDEGGVGAGEFSLLVRHGVSDRIDVGGKLWGIPPWVGLYGDVRYQLTTEPRLASVALGASWFGLEGGWTTGLYPTLLVGSERAWAGVRWVQFLGSADSVEEHFGGGVAGLVVGGAFGERVTLTPELNVYFAEDFVLLPGLAFFVRF